MTKREMVAALCSSFILICFIGLGLYTAIYMFDDAPVAPPGTLANGMFFILLFGWPVCFVSVLIVALLSKRFLAIQQSNPWWRAVVTVSSILGMISVPIALGISWQEPTLLLRIALVGLAGGCISGIVFGKIAFFTLHGRAGEMR